MPESAQSLLARSEYFEAIPDYLQIDTAFGGLPGKGRQYCAPVSVSNSLLWFAENGWPQLSELNGDRRRNQFVLARELGSTRFMNTRVESGTGPAQVCEGVEKFLWDRGVPRAGLRYQGWRPVHRRFRDGDQPNPEELVKGLAPNRAVWLNIGWYTYNEKRDEYHRDNGHWITLAGHERDSSGAIVLIVHDPGSHMKTERIRLEPIRSGRLTGDIMGLPRKAEGFFRTGLYSSRGIIDGAVILELAQPPVS